jgi:hypothetical protein
MILFGPRNSSDSLAISRDPRFWHFASFGRRCSFDRFRGKADIDELC